MKLTEVQKKYVIDKAETLANTSLWRVWGLYFGYVLIDIFVVDPTINLVFIVLFVGLFIWMLSTQKKRIVRIMALEDEKKKESNASST